MRRKGEQHQKRFAASTATIAGLSPEITRPYNEARHKARANSGDASPVADPNNLPGRDRDQTGGRHHQDPDTNLGRNHLRRV